MVLPEGFQTYATCLGPGDMSKVDKQHKVFPVPSEGCSCDTHPMRGSVLTGIATKEAWTASRCVNSAHNALCNRHAKKQHKPERAFDHANDFLRAVNSELRGEYETQLTHYAYHHLDRWTLQKQEDLKTAEAFDKHSPDKVKLFIKYETMHKEITKSRGIQGYYELGTQCKLAPYIISLQKAFTKLAWFWKRSEDDDVSITFASGLSHIDLGKWMEECENRGCSHWYERDGKNWDATMQRMHHEHKMKWYDMMPPEILKYINKGFKVRGTYIDRKGFRKYKYMLNGTVKSGHNDTTIGNSIINAMIAYESCKLLGLKAHIIVMGDDCLVGVEGDFDEHALANIEYDLGIKPEYRKFTDIRDVTFISARWYPKLGGGWCFGPLLGRQFARLFWTVTDVPKRTVQRYVNAVIKGSNIFFGDCTIMKELFNAVGTDGPSLEIDSKYVKKYFKPYDTQDVDWAEVYLDYGITMADMLQYKRTLASLPRVDGVVKSAIIGTDLTDKLHARDLVDIVDRPVLGENHTGGSIIDR